METKEGSVTKGEDNTSQVASARKSSTKPHPFSVEAKGEAMDIEEPSDTDVAFAVNNMPDENIEDVVGFSIGQEQLRMKSPDTPALEKAKVLDQSRHYFDLEPEVGDVNGGDASPETCHDNQGDSSGLHDALAGKASESPKHQTSISSGLLEAASRSGTSRSFLKDGFGPRTRRASSESTGIVGTLRKLLPDLPSMPLSKASGLPSFGFGSKPKDASQLDRPKRSSTLFSRGNLPWAYLSPSTTGNPVGEDANPFASLLTGNKRFDAKEATNSRAGPHEANELCPWTTPNQRLLRRATSEHSLFMRNELERTSTQDDAERWASVSEQINSRFKAITDSFQDSAFSRMPKMPSVSLGSFTPGLQRSNNDTAKPSKDRDVAIAQQDAPGTQSTNETYPAKQAKHAHPILNQAVPDLTGDVVVLGGYRGSILRSAKPPNKQLWVPVKVGMNLRRVDLEVGLNAEDEETMTDTIIPSGILSHIGPVDICRRLLRQLKKSSRSRPDQLRVHNYGYDWRLSPHLLSRQLITFLESLQCNRPELTGRHRGATVIAHSLGGLITRHAVNQRPDLFSGIIYAGVPQHCINILGPLRNGDDVLLSSRVLTAQVNFTLRTSYALLPESGRCFINKTTGERYDVDFFDVKTWENYYLSPCVSGAAPLARPEQRKSIIGTLSESLPSLPLTNKRSSIIRREESPTPETQSSLADAKDAVKDTAQKAEETLSSPHGQALEPSMGSSPPAAPRESIATACTIPRVEALAYLERTLKSVRQFKQELAFNPSHQAADVYPPIAVLYSNSVPTVFGARVDSREAIKRGDAYENLAFAAGDGIVLSKSARPPEGYKVVRGGLVRSERGHIGLLGDLEAVGKCLQAISDARGRGVGTGRFAEAEEGGESKS